jgi:NAD(P)-dependent dehydrogenase (short-subunit alcohol dehydrogenase family)
MSLETVVVTGSSAGLGRAIANQFGKRKAQVALLARGKKGLDAAAREIESFGGKALPLPTDVADAAEVDAAAEETERRFGPIDIWINNAMVTVFSPVKEMKPEEYKRATDVTYLGVVYGTLAALKRMLPRDRGNCTSWLCAGLPEYPIAVSLLWRQTRDHRFHRIATLRTHS